MQKDDNKLTLKVAGRLDSVTAKELEEVLDGSLEDIDDLTFDFSDLEYISSAGFRILLVTYKIMKKQGSLKVTGVHDEVRDLFEDTGFSEILNVDQETED